MSAGRRHGPVNAMLGEYALGHLPAAERREVEAHLQECAPCRADLREYTLLMDAKAHTPEPVAPRPALREHVLAGLPAQIASPAPRPWPADAVQQRRGRGRHWRVWPMAAAATLVLGVSATLLVTREAARRAEGELRATIAGLEQRLDRYSGQTDLALSILTASDMRPVALAGREGATASAARAYWSPTRGLLVVADQLPTPPPGRIYQVWVIAGGVPASAGLLGSQCPLSADLHSSDPLVPPADDASGAKPEGEGPVPVTRAVELRTLPVVLSRIVEPAGVVHGHRAPRHRLVAAADRGVGRDQLSDVRFRHDVGVLKVVSRFPIIGVAPALLGLPYAAHARRRRNPPGSHTMISSFCRRFSWLYHAAFASSSRS